MRVHISNLNGFDHAATVSIAQQNCLNIGRSMGFDELGLFHFDIKWDTPEELNKRLDGIIAPLWNDDIVILQLPTWNDLHYENRLISKIKAYSGLKLVIFVHDVVPIMFESGDGITQATVEVYNHADVLILPSVEMHEYLKRFGLNVKKVVYQELWDYPMSNMSNVHSLYRRLFFTGETDRFTFLPKWNKKTPIELYCGNVKFDLSGLNINHHGYKEQTKLIADLSEGGFGLVWAEGNQYEYYKLNQPFKLATFLAAGIPVVIREGVRAAEYVKKHKVGFVAKSLEEVDEFIQTISVEEYNELLRNVKKVQFLITNGYYTRKVLNEAVIMAMSDDV